jgi:hypothetical protein
MPATQNKTSLIRNALFVLLGTVVGAGLGYVSGDSLKRLELLRGTQRDAYVEFLQAQANLDLGKDPQQYAAKTTEARKRIAVYGSKHVVQALAKYWRGHFDQPVCAGSRQKINDDVAIYLNMRDDLVPFWQQVSAADMMLLMYLCRIPE